MTTQTINIIIKEMQQLPVGTKEYTDRWELLLNQFTPMMIGLCRRIPKQEQEDCYHSLVAIMPKSIKLYNPASSQFITWLNSICRNEVKLFWQNNRIIPMQNMISTNSYRKRKNKELYNCLIVDGLFDSVDLAKDEYSKMGIQKEFSAFTSIEPTQIDDIEKLENKVLCEMAIKYMKEDITKLSKGYSRKFVSTFKYADVFLDKHYYGMEIKDLAVKYCITTQTVSDRLMSTYRKLSKFRERNQMLRYSNDN